ncbi:MAG: Ig-like domain-containing protein, partial [Candidatus Peregrinibacteria bacterium]
DVHTPDTEDVKPEIRIIAPVANGAVSLPYVGVVVDVNSAAGVSQVDYYWDDELVDTAKVPPYRGRFKIPRRGSEAGSEHTIRAVVFDSLYHTNQASVAVKIGEDVLPPQVRFTYPQNDALLEVGSFMTMQVDAYDSNGAVQTVEFYLDGELQETLTTAPYLWQFVVPDAIRDYNLKAVVSDYAENTSTAQINIRVVAPNSLALQGDTRLIAPTKNKSYDQGEPIIVKAYVDEASRDELKELIVFYQQEGGRPVEVAKSFVNHAATHTFIWDTPSAGRYELYFKVVLQDGKIRFSEKIPIVVR